ncbi:peptide-methionine (S)-S-oxide reductase MsrA [Flavobacterium sp. MFBS3-15]|uniref:peptide-methionine (S)-S-oxide reductase MsrA n=1 Tax=Flavobacterium sp. MFBS3-15 TaxID=2989816 RepID=UPI0022364DFA|nr:peptide-methionine (S)-S-oxide reductase MsrA [Flavobacterium sp. MFBS3-15]MCW4467876.1 peptide-methionine (S)-S-oxide reductase MsrA [Flavobacterium sp. MFBS3-15]
MNKLIAIALAVVSASCQGSPKPEGEGNQGKKDVQLTDNKGEITMNDKTETAIFAGGCFWCTEAFFTDLKGVQKVVSGYIGGKTENPTYKEVCEGYTGHAEAIKITFNPDEVAYEDLLEIFFATHDPTTINRQGNDVGTQYRSEIFYTSEAQKVAAENFIKLLADQKIFDKKIVTKVSQATVFYPAEEYHQDYYSQNPNQPYCAAVIAPKLAKLKKNYKSKLKE